MAQRSVSVRLEAVTDSYRQEMQKAVKATEQLTGKTRDLDALGSKMQSVGGKMSAGLTLPIVAGVGLAVKSASDLQQAVGGTEAVFGDAADAINDYAKTAARASGLSEREFREATTSIGGQLKRMTGDVDLAAEQSMKLTGVAADLAATYGGTTAEAVAALGSAFRGEADPAERFNLNLKIGAVNAKAVAMGLAESEKEVDDNARAQATLALIMEQSADATGQFARESDSAAGSMQIAKAEMENASAEIGQALLPLVAELAGGVADLAGWFSDLPGPVQNAVLALGGLLAVTGPLLSVGGRMISNWGKISGAFDKAATGAFDASGKIGKLGKVLGGLGIAAIAFEFHKWAESMSDLNTEASKLEGLATDELASQFVDILQSGVVNAAGNAERSLELVTDSITRLAQESPAVVEQMIALAESADGELATALEAAGVGVDDLRAALDAGIGTQVAASEATERNAEILEEATGATEENTEAVEEAVDEQKELEDAIKGVTNAIRSQLDPLFAAQDALLDHKNAQDKVKAAQMEALVASQKLDSAIKEHGRTSDEAALASLELATAQQRVRDADREVVRSALDVAAASTELKARVEAGTVSIEAAEGQLRAWVTQGLITEEQAFQTAQELRSTASAADSLGGKNIHIPVSADTSAFERQIAALYRERDGIRISVGGGGGIPIRADGGPIPGAKGTPVPMIGHGGEFVLSADVVDAIKNGRPTAGLGTSFGSAPASSTSVRNGATIYQTNHIYDRPSPRAIGLENRRTMLAHL